ncbi:Protein of unknown function [Pyronema omphalodes CBS 100304]|uniref:Uncharacterized protein n=1 Tax=Pyronema omphalodes (strain CBS 100304) TaxID=1076935 RepID=U4KXF1_PYROM|nr:Protein of unknown function [Pyronema omphalodes CBS 100304]
MTEIRQSRRRMAYVRRRSDDIILSHHMYMLLKTLGVRCS